MSTPIYEQLLDLYNATGRGEAGLQEDVAYYLRNGCVHSTPEYFVMGRRIQNGWYIHAAVGAGAIEAFCAHMPYWLPYIGWERRGKPTKWYETDKLLRKLHYENGKSISTNTATSANAGSGGEQCSSRR